MKFFLLAIATSAQLVLGRPYYNASEFGIPSFYYDPKACHVLNYTTPLDQEVQLKWDVDLDAVATNNHTRLCFAGGPAHLFSTVDLIPLPFYINVGASSMLFKGAMRLPKNLSDVASPLRLEEMKQAELKVDAPIKWTLSNDVEINMSVVDGKNVTLTLDRLNVASRVFPKRAVLIGNWTCNRQDGNIVFDVADTIIDGPKTFLIFDSNKQDQEPLTKAAFDGMNHTMKDEWMARELIVCTEDIECVLLASVSSDQLLLYIIIGGCGCFLVFVLNIWACIYLRRRKKRRNDTAAKKNKHIQEDIELARM